MADEKSFPPRWLAPTLMTIAATGITGLLLLVLWTATMNRALIEANAAAIRQQQTIEERTTDRYTGENARRDRETQEASIQAWRATLRAELDEMKIRLDRLEKGKP